MRRVDPESSNAVLYTPVSTGRIAPLIADDEIETPPLPREHPQWVKDAIAVSQRTRQIIARLKPVVVRILTFWDHHVRSVNIGGRHLSVDLSGSYRIE